MVYSTYFWWFGEWFIIVLTTLYPYLPRLPAQPMGQSHGLPGSRADPGEAGKPWTCSLGCFHSHGGTPQNGWFRREDPKKKNRRIWRYPHFRKPWDENMGIIWDFHGISTGNIMRNSRGFFPRGDPQWHFEKGHPQGRSDWDLTRLFDVISF